MINESKNEKSKKQIAYEQIKDQIIRHHLKPGSFLIERQICTALNMSRVPVREAIQQLATEGLVTAVPSVGSFVSEIRYEQVSQLYTVREYIEGLGARLCAQNITDEQLQSIEKIVEDMGIYIQEGQHEKLFEADIDFHKSIIKYSRNDILISIYETLVGQILRITILIDGNAQGIVSSHNFHIEILKYIRSRNMNEAENSIRAHIQSSKLNQLRNFAPDLYNATNFRN